MSAIPEENDRAVPASALLQLMCAGQLSGQQVQQLPPAAIAYLGDAVYELYVRSRCLLPPQRLQAYHDRVVARVRAEGQAEDLQSLEAYLTPAEWDIVRRGRNAAFGRPKRVSSQTYQQATGLEMLVGYLYLTDPQRLSELLSHLDSKHD
ncbi:MAG TPA: ribonuclease III [Oscillatoriales cyanobacterium M59_W2019_021]|nr:MAG: ribonuclease III [Cyanobacteria bacterium J055]HIK30241.1 ribonuclease III [Oscillatoriales cyanobacterium M4454_W2019_049]HIK49858.1 ribonuclease III [Oscillatoriales cyanobacterium M59_W2019_021]